MGLAALLGNVTAVDAGSETPPVLLNVGRRIAIMYETALARTRSRQSRRLWLKAAGGVLCGTLACSLPGCSLGVMFGKMLGGDPMVPAEFRAMTREDLAKGKHTVLVVCTTPDSVESDLATLKFDLIDGVTRRMKFNGVKVINPDLIAKWLDEHGSIGSDLAELSQDFEADYIVHLDVQEFGFREPNAHKLLRGHSAGFVRVFKVEEAGSQRIAHNVYSNEFTSTYPTHQPISEQTRTSISFQKDYVDRVCDQLAQKFYDHRPGTDF